MSVIEVYMEGGAPRNRRKKSKEGVAQLRSGMEEFLRQAAQDDLRKYITVRPCGPRNKAIDKFLSARKRIKKGKERNVAILLVDSEQQLNDTPREHIETMDHCSLIDAPDQHVHLMVQIMEAWIIADRNALREYYGKDFAYSSLPNNKNLEEVAKKDVLDGLYEATRRTKRGKYHKINHARVLLGKFDAIEVQKRCPRCANFFKELADIIGQLNSDTRSRTSHMRKAG